MVALLVASLLLCTGTVAMIRWSAILLAAERDQTLRFEVLRALAGVLETGAVENRFVDAGESATAHAVAHTMAGDTLIRITVQDQRSGPAGDPAPGVYRSITATWAGPHGAPQRLSIHTFWHPSRRIY
jgi:hypothetical protein